VRAALRVTWRRVVSAMIVVFFILGAGFLASSNGDGPGRHVAEVLLTIAIVASVWLNAVFGTLFAAARVVIYRYASHEAATSVATTG